MRHVDPDTLALLALGEKVADGADRTHLAECEQCAAELANFSRVANVGRSTLDADLVAPAPRVWDRISEELQLEPTDAPVVELKPRRPRWLPVVAVAASVAIVASLGVAIWQLAQPAAPTVLASATLDAFPDWPDASGSAVVEQLGDGTRIVQLEFEAPGLADQYTEVWLISSDATQLVSLGIARGNNATLPIPDGIDLAVYDLVDVSAEPYDGDPTHSGDSIVRGQLS